MAIAARRRLRAKTLPIAAQLQEIHPAIEKMEVILQAMKVRPL